MPEVPQVKTCCLCCSTEVGSKIIGWWLLISGIIETVSWIFYLIKSLGPNQPHEEDKVEESNENYCYFSSNNEEICIKGATTNSIIEIIFSVFIVLMGVYLLHGVYRRNMRYVKTWLTLASVYLILLAIGIVVLLIQGHVDVLSQIINFLLVAYFIVVVYSYYRENLNTAPTTY